MSINQKLVSLGLAFESVNNQNEPVIVINYDNTIRYLIQQLEQQQLLINNLTLDVKALCAKDGIIMI
jgi:hypothetical protein